jgi:N-acetylglucosamine-6-sulfatase
VAAGARVAGRAARSVVVAATILLVAATLSRGGSAQTTPAGKPNVILILTDDQRTSDLRHMPNVRGLLTDQGTTFENHVLTEPVCCPSRASFLRGQYPHNHHVIGQGANGFAKRGLDESTTAVWLHEQGYQTGYVGKYLNGYKRSRYVPPGWDSWSANVDDAVWARCLAVNGHQRCADGNPDERLAERAATFLRKAAGNRPFFLVFSPSAPHQFGNGPPITTAKDRRRFKDAKLPRSPSFNEKKVSDKPKFLREPRLDNGAIKALTKEHRARIASLQVVDRAVGDMVRLLAERGALDNTYIFFTTDNGYLLGEHRMAGAKALPYVEAVNFPLLVRGPGVPAGVVRPELVANIDLAPTLAQIAGAAVPSFVDGRSMLPLLSGVTVPWRSAVLIERTGGHLPFSGVLDEDGGWYTEWKRGAQELYDLRVDPYQLQNAIDETSKAAKTAAMRTRLDALRNCVADACRSAEGP